MEPDLTSIEESVTTCKGNNDKEKWYIAWRRRIFPIYESLEADKYLKKKEKRMLNPKDNTDTQYCSDMIEPYLKLSVSEAEVFLDRTLDYKKSLEEKAKTNVIGITIASSLILGLSATISSNNISYLSLRIIAFGLAVFSILQMIIAGILSSIVLSELNRHYQLFPEDITDPEDQKLRTIAIDTELNINLNVRRNNYMNSSYKSIKIAIISLLVLFLFLAIPNMFLPNINQYKIQALSNENQKLERNQIDLNTKFYEIDRSQNRITRELQELKRVQAEQIKAIGSLQTTIGTKESVKSEKKP